MNVAICDDCLRDAEQIRDLLLEHFEQNGYMGEIHIFPGGQELLGAFAVCAFDAVFLDIYMDEMDGMKTAKRLRELDPNFALVFITASRDHAMESFAHRPSYYVPKPIGRRDIENAFRQCRHVFLRNARYVEVMSERARVKIPHSKIMFVETYGRETVFHTSGGEIRTTAQLLLDNLEQTLGDSFLRCHRSYIVNLNHVEAVGAEEIKLRDGRLIPLRQRGRSELREAYAGFLSNRLFEALP